MREQQIRKILSQGAVSASELREVLGVNQSTISRQSRKIPDLIRFGETNRSHYGLKREIGQLGNEQGIYEVSEEGELNPRGSLVFLTADQTVILPEGELFDGFPPQVYDMMPQGFMGRAFAHKHGDELGFPNQLRDWTDAQKLIAISRRGEDLPGSWIVGRESAERWQQLELIQYSRSDLSELAERAEMGHPVGSSAGGEQPKFSVVIDGVHYLLKFARIGNTEVSRRWVELVRCENQALEILSQAGIPVAATQLHDTDDYLFLLSERFDRKGIKGRRPVVSLSAVDNHFYGHLYSWSQTAEKLQKEGRFADQTLRCIRIVEAFSMLIGDNDRHFHNLSLIPDRSFEKFELAPVYDKLPMLFAPQNDRVIERQMQAPVPDVSLFEVWDEARELANEFWRKTEFRSFNR